MQFMNTLSVIYGLLVGVSLGLTGGGGSIFAVPLLLYGLAVPVTAAMGLSLATVGATAGFGAFLRWLHGDVEWRSGLVFAAAGMLVAPLGTKVAHELNPQWLLAGFALLMMYVGLRMWRGRNLESIQPGPCVAQGNGKLQSKCYIRLVAGGAAAGFMSGLFGVGGGFIVVPVLLFVTGMSIHKAVATSLLVIFMISISGVAAHIMHGQQFPMPLSVLFVLGGLAGMLLGNAVRSRLTGPTLQRVFAVGMWLVAGWMLIKNL